MNQKMDSTYNFDDMSDFDIQGEGDNMKGRAKRQENRANRKGARIERKAARNNARVDKKTSRTDRKDARAQGRTDRKDARAQGKTDRKQNRVDRRQDRKDTNAQERQDRKSSKIRQQAQQLDQEGREGKGLLDPNQATPQEIEGNEGQYYPEIPLNDEVRGKAISYLERRGRTPAYEEDGTLNSDVLAGQFNRERDFEIQQRYDEKIQYLEDNEISNSEEWLQENMPEYDEVWDEMLEEEENTFSFNGDADNFIDPMTAATLVSAGNKGLAAYRQKRFDAGKRWNGQTRKQWEAKQTIDPNSTPAGAFRNEVVNMQTREVVREKTPLIILGVVLVVAAIAFAYTQGQKK